MASQLKSSGAKTRSPISDALIFTLLSIIVLLAGLFTAGSNIISTNTFLPGSSLNGVDISGLSYEQALDKLIAYENERIQEVNIAVSCGGVTQLFTALDAGAVSNALKVYAQELSAVREGSAPQRFAALYRLRDGMELPTSIIYDRDKLNESVAEFAKQFSIEAHNASAVFDFDSEMFTYLPDSSAVYLDQNVLSEQLWAQFDSGDTSKITIPLTTENAAITLESVKNNMKLIGTCITALTDNEDRTNNIRLITEVVNRLTVEPGQSVSINELTGRRSEEKGYKPARAIQQGQYVDEYGGGVCQLSGTLYNALLLAGAEIVQRSQHSLPSYYLPLGLDSAIDYDSNKDLVFKNISPYPMYILAKIQGEELMVKIYGAYPAENMKFELETKIVATTKPDAPIYINDSSLSKGVTQKVSDEVEGNEVEVYRKVFVGEEWMETQLVSRDFFEAQPATYRVGTKVSGRAEGKDD